MALCIMIQIYRTKRTLLLILTISILISCGPRLVYPHLNWLIPWYISDYISFDSTQKNLLKQRLLKQLDWHCRTQLPAYAELLRAIGRDFANADQPLTYLKIQFYYKKLMELWKELMKQIGPDIYDIISTASDSQIDELIDNLSKQNKEFKEEYVDPPIQKLNEKRRKRVIDRLEDWISDLTTEQKAAVASWNNQLVPLAEEWLENRENIQAEARRLLSQRRTDPEFRTKFLELVVNPGQMRSPAYQAKIDANMDITFNFISQLSGMLTPRQRSYLLKRIESLAADFDKLSCDPKKIPKGSGFKGSEVQDR
jgi:hypothetical protein